MPRLIVPVRGRHQPQVPRVDFDNPITAGLTEVVVPPHFKTALRHATMSINSGSIAVGPAGGLANAFAYDGTNANGVVFAQANIVAPHAGDFTAFVLRRCRDTTARGSTLFGYNAAVGDRILAHAPFSDGTLYWDYANSTSGSGRVSVAFTKTTKIEALVFIAGGGKGREVWRDGVKIVSNTSATATRTVGTQNFTVGGMTSSPTVTSDLEELFLFGALARAWSDAEVQAWTANPWSIFENRSFASRLPVIAATGSGGGAVRPQVFTCT